MNEITIIDMPNIKVMGMKKTGRYKDLIPSMLQQLYQHLMKNDDEVCCGPPMFICHDTCVEEVIEADKNGTAVVKVAIPIMKEIDQTDDMKIYNLSGGKMAKIIHKGSYENMNHKYEKHYKWIKENNKSITCPSREVYVNDPKEVTIENILTEIYAPFKYLKKIVLIYKGTII